MNIYIFTLTPKNNRTRNATIVVYAASLHAALEFLTEEEKERTRNISVK